MPIVEDAKEFFERATGLRRPGRRELPALLRPTKPAVFRFGDDGRTPNNPYFPLVVYRAAFAFPGTFDPAAVIEEVFAHNGWKDSWRDGVYPFLHFHTQTHEALGIARGAARIRFGGSKGQTIALQTGDAIVLPAGTGHRRMSASKDLLVVGAYPARSRYDEPRPAEIDHDQAVIAIAGIRAPAKDPVYGAGGPLLRLWEKRRRRPVKRVYA